MAYLTETKATDWRETCGCGDVLPLEILAIGGDYSLGYHCLGCDRWRRATGYYETYEMAREDLDRVESGGLPTNVRHPYYGGK